MELHLLRSCFKKNNRGIWKPKKVFDSIEHAERLGFTRAKKWEVYTCKVCGKFHVASIRK